MELIHPEYHKKFRCIGPACEDTCCQGWVVPLDKATYEKYADLPPGELTTLIHQNIALQPQDTGIDPLNFARIEMNPAKQCPFLSDERLCRIQLELGGELLARTCDVYPRVVKGIAGVHEVALSLSCPEAARIVLLDPDLLAPVPVDPDPVLSSRLHQNVPADSGPSEQSSPASAALPWIWPIRRSVLATIRNRTYPLGQRLFLLGVLCRRIDAVLAGETTRSIDTLLGDFDSTVASGSLRPAMEMLPIDATAQLEILLHLSGMMLKVSNVLPRFLQCIHEFTTGIGNRPDATLETLTRDYTQAHDRWFAPFIARHPQILENLLVNTVFRTRFPLGTSSRLPSTPSSLTRQAEMLAAQFVLARGLLIGVAGFHRDEFCADHVVFAVQAAAKHFEHHPDFLDSAHALLVENHMDGSRGLAILLREPTAAIPKRTAGSIGELPVPAELEWSTGAFTPPNSA